MYPPEKVIPKFIKESRRVTKSSGTIISVDIAPDWYGGELAHIIDDQSEGGSKRNQLFIEAGFTFFDLIQTSYHGSLEKIIRTYGFIFGEKVITHIKQNNVTSIKWKFRAYYEKQCLP